MQNNPNPQEEKAKVEVFRAENVKKISLINPVTMKRAMQNMNVFRVPSLIDPQLSPEDLLYKHRKTLDYRGNPYKARDKEGYIFRQFILVAETVEQQAHLYNALDDAVALSEKPERYHEVWNAVMVEKRPTYLFASVKQTEIDMQTFLPVWKVLETKEENEKGQFLIRVGVPAEEIGMDKPLPFIEFYAPTMRDGMKAAYEFFLKLRMNEEKMFSELLNEGSKKVTFSSHLVYLSRILQSRENKNKIVYYLGQDIMALVRVDPHREYLLAVRKRMPNTEGAGYTYIDYNLYFEAARPINAVMAVEFYRRQMRLVTIPRFPPNREDSVMPAMVGYYRAKAANEYAAKNVTVNKRLTLPEAQVYEFIALAAIGKEDDDEEGEATGAARAQTALTVVVPVREEEEELTENEMPFAYIFTGSVKQLSTKFNWEDVTKQRSWNTDFSTIEVNLDSINDPIDIVGEIRVKGDSGMVIRLKRDSKTNKMVPSKKRQFAIDRIVDTTASIAAMGMELLEN